MKKNKIFAGVLVLLFVLSFSVSQVLLAQETNLECESNLDGGSGVSQRCAQRSTPNESAIIVWNCNCRTMGPQNVTQWGECQRPRLPGE